MGRWGEVLQRMRASPANVRFSELVGVLGRIGYTLRRSKGSHRIYTAPGLPIMNLQDAGGKAKPYQVKQVLEIIDAHNLEVD